MQESRDIHAKDIKRLNSNWAKIYIESKVKKWKFSATVFLLFALFLFMVVLLFLGQLANWNFNIAYNLFFDLRQNLVIISFLFISGVFFSYTCKLFYDRHFNHSNIENYKKGIEVPVKDN